MFMSGQIFWSLRNAQEPPAGTGSHRPIWTGVLLSVSNPYFLLWWATVGLSLANDARKLGIGVYVLFAVVHWLCDLIWFEALSWTSFKGSQCLGPRRQKTILLLCALTLLGFGLSFIYRAMDP